MTKYGWRNNDLVANDVTINNDLTIEGDMSFGDASTDTLTMHGALSFDTAATNAINVTVPMTSEGGWDVGAVFQHGSMSVPLDYGTVASSDLVLLETSIEAIATGQWVIGQVNQITSGGVSTGYFLGGYNYLLIGADSGAGIGFYSEIDLSGTSALSGNHSGLYSEIIVAAGSVITGAGKIAGLLVEMNVVAGATVAQGINGIEVDMRDIRVDTAGEKIGLKVTMAGGSNFIDYGMQFSNDFSTATAVLNFDLTQGNAPIGILMESGTHTTGTAIALTGAHTNLFSLPAEGTAPVSDTTNVVFSTDPVKISILVDGVQYYMLAAKDFS